MSSVDSQKSAEGTQSAAFSERSRALSSSLPAVFADFSDLLADFWAGSSADFAFWLTPLPLAWALSVLAPAASGSPSAEAAGSLPEPVCWKDNSQKSQLP
jgi:hypothetical protein